MSEHIVSREHAKKHVHKRIRTQMRLYFLMAAVMVIIVIFNLVTGKLNIELSFAGILGGIVLGIISSRMFHISWDHDARKVISQVDKFGVVVIAGYIIFELSREWLFSHYVNGALTGALTFAFLAGVMIGRVLGTRGKILRVLKEQQVFIK